MSYNELSISLSNKIALCGAMVLLCFLAKAQDSTSIVVPDTTRQVVEVERGRVTGDVKEVEGVDEILAQQHSPKKATILSAILPGAGQIYNKKWWKVPILYGGFAVAGYFLYDNIEHIDLYKNAYIAATDGDPNTSNTTGYSNNNLLDLIDQYKTWRDLSYISIVVIYALNIIDANVDAHLFYFDVSEDISLNVQPYVSPFRSQSAGLTLSLKF